MFSSDDYVVEVEVSSHDDLRLGVLALRRDVPGGRNYSTVHVSRHEVGSDSEAMCVAAQIAACTSGGMPTATRLVSFPV